MKSRRLRQTIRRLLALPVWSQELFFFAKVDRKVALILRVYVVVEKSVMEPLHLLGLFTYVILFGAIRRSNTDAHARIDSDLLTFTAASSSLYPCAS